MYAFERLKTPKDIIDYVEKFLLKQGARSVHLKGYGGCAYRGTKGRKCAVGCLIPPSMYSKKMEDKSVWAIQEMDTVSPKFRKFLQKNSLLLIELQCIHDGAYVCTWKERFKTLRERASNRKKFR